MLTATASHEVYTPSEYLNSALNTDVFSSLCVDMCLNISLGEDYVCLLSQGLFNMLNVIPNHEILLCSAFKNVYKYHSWLGKTHKLIYNPHKNYIKLNAYSTAEDLNLQFIKYKYLANDALKMLKSAFYGHKFARDTTMAKIAVDLKGLKRSARKEKAILWTTALKCVFRCGNDL
ncbi:hypothetical protein ENBRE01_2823 [Enteropsectra breve]|nr:hypothetical protein ENBRE01_2255 [Enteropsectra breve]KAI5152428.1 hypothetical protein ENBRE01_2823 [Enteropsectra breve]